MSDAAAIIFAHVADTLLDSLSARKAVLAAMDQMLLKSHPAKKQVRAMLAELEELDQAQGFLSAEFRNLLKGEGK